ncbi:MAG TPA: glycine betaine ABC transporter substrate-binding protein [Devosia sp.]|nr:glycine betaine ABC transporter substrate-binding protein [Devosia sp.]
MPSIVLRAAFALLFACAAALPALGQDANVPPLGAPDTSGLLAPPGTDPDNPGSDDGAGGNSFDGGSAEATPCGDQTITIARMAWPSAALLAEIHARLLRSQFSCSVQVVASDLAPTLSGMAATGQPAVAPEMWLDRVADQWNQAVKDQKLRQVGQSYAESQFEGWYVPDYVASAHPELKSASALKQDWQVFANGAPKAKFISCPADWACAVINRNLIKAEGLESLFDIVEPKNRFDLDQMIAAAASRKQPIVFYYWQPNAALSQLNFKPLDLGPFDKDKFACLGRRSCADPQPSSFAAEPVVVALAQWVFTDTPEVAAYFQRAQMPMAEMDKMLAELNEPGMTIEQVADRFVADRQEVWQKWLGGAPVKPVDGSAPAGGSAGGGDGGRAGAPPGGAFQ